MTSYHICPPRDLFFTNCDLVSSLISFMYFSYTIFHLAFISHLICQFICCWTQGVSSVVVYLALHYNISVHIALKVPVLCLGSRWLMWICGLILKLHCYFLTNFQSMFSQCLNLTIFSTRRVNESFFFFFFLYHILTSHLVVSSLPYLFIMECSDNSVIDFLICISLIIGNMLVTFICPHWAYVCLLQRSVWQSLLCYC